MTTAAVAEIFETASSRAGWCGHGNAVRIQRPFGAMIARYTDTCSAITEGVRMQRIRHILYVVPDNPGSDSILNKVLHFGTKKHAHVTFLNVIQKNSE